MAEDWSGIAAEVAGALRSIGDVTQSPGGYPILLRAMVSSGVRPRPGTPPPMVPAYYQFYGIEDYSRLRDIDGTMIDKTVHTLTVDAVAGVTPTEDMHVALGRTVADANDALEWRAIVEVRPLSPVGIPVLYDIDIEF